MPVDLNGMRGEIRAGGRWAATLSGVVCHVSPTDAISASGRIDKRDDYRLEHGGRYVLVLIVGKRLWQWRDVTVTVDGDRVTVAGQGRPDIR
jgi:hypothetical protein